MEHIKKVLIDDLCHISSHLEVVFAQCNGVVILSGMQTDGIATRDLAMLLVDSSEDVSQTGPVAQEARRCARALGYGFNWHPGAELAFAVNGASKLLSAHEKMRAVNMFSRPLRSVRAGGRSFRS